MSEDMPVPLVDVLIPAYNAASTIVEAITSVQRQSVRDLRIVVVNDGSRDATGTLVRDLAREDPRIVLVEQENAGIVQARNVTIAHSRAPFVAMHDADDRSFPDRLERQLAYLRDHSDCVAVSGNAWYIDEGGRRLGGRSDFSGDVTPDPDSLPSAEPYLPQPFVMIRHDAIVAAGGYRELTNAEDTDLYWRLLPLGRLHNLPDVLGEYRMHAVSASAAAAKSGRISAVSSQLSAISYQRRRAGGADLDFSADLAARLVGVDGVEQMLALVAPQLSARELAHLRLAVAAKLLELASYRPYLLHVDDCRFISQALPQIRACLTRRERLLLTYRQAHVLGKLLRATRWREAAALRAPAAVYANVIPAMAARRVKAVLQSRRARTPVSAGLA